MDKEEYEKLEAMYKAQEARIRAETAAVQQQVEVRKLKPSWYLPVEIYRDGSKWVCILESSEELLDCPVAYGDSPKQACDNFDALWIGSGFVLPDNFGEEDDEDEDQEEYTGGDDEYEEEF